MRSLNLVCFALLALAATTASAIDLSPDITVDLDGDIIADHDVVIDEGAPPATIVDLGSLPPEVEVDAYHLGDDGSEYFSLDLPAALAGGVDARPADLVRWDGNAYSIAFDASAHGLGDATDLDAATRSGSSWLFSFDTSVEIGALAFDDDDVIAFDGAGFSMYADGASLGIPIGLDLDALHAFSNVDTLALSFDGSGRLGGVDFADEDVLLLTQASVPGGGAWYLYHDSSSESLGWAAADVGAVHVVPEPTTALGFVSGTVFLATAARRRRSVAARVSATLATCALLVGLAPPAHAGDGVVEINQACAEHTGCFAGDAPGFPVTITGAAGSNYRFTSDVDVQAISTGIEITQPGVHIDLNGFTLSGITTCTGEAPMLVCAPTGLFHGIEGPERVSISNGRITGFPGAAIWIESGRVVGMEVTRNASGGIRISTPTYSLRHDSIVLDTIASENGGNGMYVQRARVSGCMVSGNVNIGIDLLNGGLISNSEISRNGTNGIAATGGTSKSALIHDNLVRGNSAAGIWTGAEATIRDNVVTENGGDGIDAGTIAKIESNIVSRNGGHGIYASARGLITNNTLSSNSDHELYFRGTRSAYRDNLISSTSTTTVGFAGNATAVNRGGNTCNGSVVCP